MLLTACSGASAAPTLDPINTPTAAPTELPAIEVSATQSVPWPTEEWSFSIPEDQGFDPLILEEMSQYLRQNEPSARSVLIVRNGYLVYEDYIKGDESHAGPVWSVTKSVLSALVGIALEDGILGDLEDNMMDYLAEFRTEETDPGFDDITLEHLLTMTAGFRYHAGGASSVPAAFREKLASDPGEEAQYSSTSTHLLSAVIQNAVGESALAMANERVFSPLGIEKPIWSADGYGTSMGGWGLQLRPRDMAKIGYLYLNDGLWEGNQIISADWIETSTSEHAEAGIPELAGFANYGYLWWIHPFGEYKAFSAFGAGGQMIMVVPELELVVVSTADSSQTMNPSSRVMEYVRRAIVAE